jgi:hypothetical protein
MATPSPPLLTAADVFTWTSLIGPAVVAAVVSSLVSVIGILISAWTARRIHTERLAFERDQAERKFTYDVGVTEAKIRADTALSEKRVELDRKFATWKRRMEFAEEILADFYEARDIIQAARSPAAFANEGLTRPKTEWETERDEGLLNSYYATTERLNGKAEFFGKLYARRFRFLALFGAETKTHFDVVFQIRHELNVAVHMLISTQRGAKRGLDVQQRGQWEDRIWDTQDVNDRITSRLNQSVEGIEAVCRPALQEVAP